MTDLAGLIVSVLGRKRAWRLGRALYMRARGEKATNAIAKNGEAVLIERAVRAGDPAAPLTFLDVGANLGEWTDCALKAANDHGRPLTIHLFEPTPAAAERLETRYVGRKNVHVHRIALSCASGSARFALFGDTAGTNSLEAHPESAPLDTIDVVTDTGAAFAAAVGISAIDLVKVDTEGHDYAVLAGLEPLLGRGAIAAVQFEYNSRWLTAHRSMRDVFDLAQRTQYRLGRVMADRIELFDRWNPECDRYFEDNFVLIRPDMVAPLAGHAMRWGDFNTLEAAVPLAAG